jgi:O-antigen/teichoic acid export membrane protein
LSNLGIVDYGIYSVIGGVIAMLAFFNNAMTSSTQRHLSYEMGRGSLDDVTKTFNASLRIHFFICLIILVVLETFGIFFVRSVLEIPADRMDAALWIYQCVIFILIFNIMSIPYQAITNAKEDMHVVATRGIFDSIGKLVIAILLGLTVAFDKLKLYGVLLTILSFIISFSFFTFCRKKYPECKFKREKYDKALYKELLGFAGWTMFGALAAISRIQGLTIILNLFFGPKMNAAFGISNQISSQLLALSNTFLQASNPQIVKSFGSGDTEKTHKLSMFISRFSFYVLFLISLPIFVKIDFILSIWLKEIPPYANIFSRLMIVNFLVGVLTNPLITVMQATGKIKYFQIVNSVIFLMNIPIAYLLLKFEYPPYYVIYSLIVITVIGNIAKLMFVSYNAGLVIKEWLQTVLYNVMAVSAVSVAAAFLPSLLIKKETFLLSIVSFAYIFLVILISIWFFGFQKSEKGTVQTFVKNIYNRRLKK